MRDEFSSGTISPVNLPSRLPLGVALSPPESQIHPVVRAREGISSACVAPARFGLRDPGQVTPPLWVLSFVYPVT